MKYNMKMHTSFHVLLIVKMFKLEFYHAYKQPIKPDL